MEHNKLSTEEMVMMARDMTANPEKYGITRDKIHRWATECRQTGHLHPFGG